MTTPAHPQRCEKCEKYSITTESGMYRPTLMRWCSNYDGKPRWISRAQVDIIEKVGCASHSSVQPRDQVLLDAMKCHALDIITLIDEYRTQGSRDQNK